jgi:hypothetical protein
MKEDADGWQRSVQLADARKAGVGCRFGRRKSQTLVAPLKYCVPYSDGAKS